MFNLEGQIATLYQEGRQVAGVYDWESHIILDYTTVDNMKVYKPHKIINARSYWLVEPVKENVFYAEFYQTLLDNLILIDAGNVAIDFPDCATIDRRLYAPIEIKSGWVVVNTEAIVYLLRKTNLTRSEIGKLNIKQFQEILKEVSFQESVDYYRNQYSVATLLAAIYNTIPRKSGHKALTAKDFLSGDMPTRDGKQPSPVDELARKKGIKLPSK